MAKEFISLKREPSISDLQAANNQIYGDPNDRFFDLWDILSNQERFMMRALKGIRKGDPEKIKTNIIIATSWYMSIMNRLHINLEEAVWQRFPYLCSYCASAPCQCKKLKPKNRPRITRSTQKKPKSLSEYQKMFHVIYPHNSRTLEHAGIHLAEEQGEMSEAIHQYLGYHSKKYFQNVVDESADYFSCLMGVCNSTGIDFEKEMAKFYSHNCHACGNAPCTCDFKFVAEYQS